MTAYFGHRRRVLFEKIQNDVRTKALSFRMNAKIQNKKNLLIPYKARRDSLMWRNR
jgi:hypothetical protein